MIRQLGPFQIFATFTMAETHWAALLRNLYQLAFGKSISDQEALDLPWITKVRLIRDDSVTVARCYCNRRSHLISALRKHSSLIGRVTDFFWRDKFQQRGTPHTHAAFYLADSPRYGIDDDSVVVAYIDSLVTCSLTGASMSDLNAQFHHHSKDYCLTRKSPGEKLKCRFAFPRPPLHETMILRPLPESISEFKK